MRRAPSYEHAVVRQVQGAGGRATLRDRSAPVMGKAGAPGQMLHDRGRYEKDLDGQRMPRWRSAGRAWVGWVDEAAFEGPSDPPRRGSEAHRHADRKANVPARHAEEALNAEI